MNNTENRAFICSNQYLLNAFISNDDFCWTSNCAYLAVVEYQDGKKNFAYIKTKDHDGGLEISVSHAKTDSFDLTYLQNFEVLKIAKLDDLNSWMSGKNESDIAESSTWQPIPKNYHDDGNIPYIGWGLVHLHLPEVDLDIDHSSRVVGHESGDIVSKFVVANIGYDLMQDAETLGLELNVLCKCDIELSKITLEEQPLEFINATAYKYVPLDIEAILNA